MGPRQLLQRFCRSCCCGGTHSLAAGVNLYLHCAQLNISNLFTACVHSYSSTTGIRQIFSSSSQTPAVSTTPAGSPTNLDGRLERLAIRYIVWHLADAENQSSPRDILREEKPCHRSHLVFDQITLAFHQFSPAPWTKPSWGQRPDFSQITCCTEAILVRYSPANPMSRRFSQVWRYFSLNCENIWTPICNRGRFKASRRCAQNHGSYWNVLLIA